MGEPALDAVREPSRRSTLGCSRTMLDSCRSLQLMGNSENTICNIKRLIGRKFNDPIVQVGALGRVARCECDDVSHVSCAVRVPCRPSSSTAPSKWSPPYVGVAPSSTAPCAAVVEARSAIE